MTSVIPILCLGCKRLKRSDSTCSAFPDGIPPGILGGDDHREPVPGDGGKVFLPRTDPAGREAFEMWRRVFGPSTATQTVPR